MDVQELQVMRSECCGEVNSDEVVQIWGFDDSENFVSEWK